jgi:hypothetical protein
MVHHYTKALQLPALALPRFTLWQGERPDLQISKLSTSCFASDFQAVLASEPRSLYTSLFFSADENKTHMHRLRAPSRGNGRASSYNGIFF